MSDPIVIDTDIGIDAAPARVWAILTDFTAYAVWNPYLVRVEGALVPGTVVHLQSVHIPGKAPTPGVATLISATFPEMRWEGGHPDRAIFRGDHVFACLPDAAGCRFHHHEAFTGLSAERLIGEHGARIEANFRLFNEALKRAAER